MQLGTFTSHDRLSVTNHNQILIFINTFFLTYNVRRKVAENEIKCLLFKSNVE